VKFIYTVLFALTVTNPVFAEETPVASYDVVGQLYDQATLPQESEFVGVDRFFAGRCTNVDGQIMDSAFVLVVKTLTEQEVGTEGPRTIVFVLEDKESSSSRFDEGFSEGERIAYQRAVIRESLFVETVRIEDGALLTTMPAINDVALYTRVLQGEKGQIWVTRFNGYQYPSLDTHRCVFDRQI